jgi:hypothetical protein
MWMLIIYAFSGGMSGSDSVALTTVGSFQNEQSCIIAGDKTKTMSRGTLKEIRYTCVKV